MDWNWREAFERVERQADDFYRAFAEGVRDHGLRSLASPIDPFNRSAVLTPIVAAAGIVGIVLLSGVVIASAVTAASALLALYFLLSRVFGFDIVLDVPGQAAA